MAYTKYEVPGNFKYDNLKIDLNTTDTEIEIYNSVDTPCLAVISEGLNFNQMLNSETILLTSASSSGYNVIRNYDGRGATTHAVGDYVLYNVMAEHYTGLLTEMNLLKVFIYNSYGTGYYNGFNYYGIVRTSTTSTDLKVAPSSLMNIEVEPGFALLKLASGETGVACVNLESKETGIAISKPSSNSWIALVYIDQYSVIGVKYGTASSTPVAPDPNANTIPLAEITVSHDQTEITSGDIDDERQFF
jgi:hypothetical protein